MPELEVKDIEPRGPQPDSLPDTEPDDNDDEMECVEYTDEELRDPDNEDDEQPERRAWGKSFACELKAEHDDERTFIATITTESVDRDGDVVIAKGLDFQAYLKNPVVLLGHPFGMDNSFDLPIGKANWIKAKGRKVIAEVTPAPTELGNEIFDLVKGKFLRAVSIGFRSLESGPPTEKELRARPEWAGAKHIFRKTELVEFSVVNVPSQPEALISAINKGHLSVRTETLERFGLGGPFVKPSQVVRLRDIKRIRHIRRCHTVLPCGIDADQVRRIVRQTADTARGRMVAV